MGEFLFCLIRSANQYHLKKGLIPPFISDFCNTLVEDKLTGFRYYIESIEQFFHQRENRLNDLIQASKKKGEDPSEWRADSYWLTTETNLMRMSLFLSLYAFLELMLTELCRFEQIEREISIACIDFKGKGIERSKTYLTKVIGIDSLFSESESKWSELKNYQKLRNHLAHKGLRLTFEDRKNNKSLERFIKQHSELHHHYISDTDTDTTFELISQEEIQEYKQLFQNKKFQIRFEGFLGSDRQFGIDDDNIEFKAGFCEEVVNTIDSFWKQLIEKIQNGK